MAALRRRPESAAHRPALAPFRETPLMNALSRRVLPGLIALAAAAAQGPALATTPLYGVTDLGDFYPTGVNDSAWVTGYDGRALLWRPGIGITDLGVFGTPPTGAVSNRANAVNNAGQVVGFTWSTAETAYRAFLWQENSGLVDLGDLPGGSDYSRADAINAHGAVAGRAGGQFVSHPSFGNLSFNHAVHFAAPDVLTDLEARPEGTLSSIARGINDFEVVVGERDGSFGTRAIVWDAGAATDLGALWGVVPAGSQSFARDVNNHGQVALQLPLAAGGSTAAIWQQGVGFTEIGRLTGATNASASAINDAGQAVGFAGPYGVAGTRAWLWTAGEGLQDLNDLLDPALGAGWLVLDANAISESGLVAGRGWHPSLGYRAILMTPVPEPASALLLAGGIAALLARRRRAVLAGD